MACSKSLKSNNGAIMDLPDECWELIFNRIDNHRHLDAISLVSKTFLSISSSLLQTLTISDPKRFLRHCNISKLFGTRFKQIKRVHITNRWSSSEDALDLVIVEIARSGLGLEELSISHFKKITLNGFVELGSNMKNLTSLSLKYCGLNDSILIAISKFLPWIQELDISHPVNSLVRSRMPLLYTNHVTYEGIKALASNLKELRKINLSGHAHLSSSYDRWLFELFSNCVSLNEFAVGHSTVEEDVTGFAVRSQLCSMYGGYHFSSHNAFAPSNYARSLSALEFWGSQVSDTLLRSIKEACLPLLKKLKFHSCYNITFSGFSTLLHEYHSLKELTVESALLTDHQVNHLSKYLCNLTHINLSRCEELTNSTFFIIARSCPLLVEFMMESTSLGKGHDYFPPADTRKNSRIQSLGLCRNRSLNDKTLITIASICPNLLMLDISVCSRITEKGTSAILRICPGIMHFKVNNVFNGKNILGTDSENSKLNIEVLETSMLDMKGMAMIGMRCPGLLELNFFHKGVTAEGVKEVVRKCGKLREINLTLCENIDVTVLYWMLATSVSLRKIVFPYGSRVTEEDRVFFMRHGCQLSGMCEHSIEQTYEKKRELDSKVAAKLPT